MTEWLPPSVNITTEGSLSHQLNSLSSVPVSRRRLLRLAAAASAIGAGIVAGKGAAEPVWQLLSERPRANLDARNIGLITAYKEGFTPAENKGRNQDLWSDLTPMFGRLLLRGRYVENRSASDQQATEIEAFVIFGNADDSGNLKGTLKKLGRKYGQDAVIHKPDYRDTQLYALRDLPDIGLRDRDSKNLGRFHLDLVGRYYTLMTKRDAWPPPSALGELRMDLSHAWRDDRWEGLGFWAQQSRLYGRPSTRRFDFNEMGIHDIG